jgi:transposase-like protein
MKLAAAAAGLAVLAGGIGTGVVMAQDDHDKPATHQAAGHQGDQKAADDFIKRLAKKLGIDEQKLRDAMKQAGSEWLDQAVKDGTIPQQMADRLRDAINNGQLPSFGFGPGGGHKGGGHPGPNGMAPQPGQGGGPLAPNGAGPGPRGIFGFLPGGGDITNALGTFLGISSDQVKSEMQGGASLAEVAQAHGKSRDQLKAFITQEAEKRIQEAVTNGKLTADQAQKLRNGLSGIIDGALDARPGMGHGDRQPQFGRGGNRPKDLGPGVPKPQPVAPRN